MFRTFLLVAVGMAIAANVRGQRAQQVTAPKIVRLTLARENNDEATTKFSSDARKIRAIWKGGGLQAGDKLHLVWIADDVGGAAPKHTPITASDVTAYKPDDDGVFALGRPKEGWPAGKYRVELYLNNKLINSQSFVIERGATIEINQAPDGTQTSAPLQEEPSPAVQPKQ